MIIIIYKGALFQGCNIAVGFCSLVLQRHCRRVRSVAAGVIGYSRCASFAVKGVGAGLLGVLQGCAAVGLTVCSARGAILVLQEDCRGAAGALHASAGYYDIATEGTTCTLGNGGVQHCTTV